MSHKCISTHLYRPNEILKCNNTQRAQQQGKKTNNNSNDFSCDLLQFISKFLVRVLFESKTFPLLITMRSTMLNSDVRLHVLMLWMKAKMSCKMRHTNVLAAFGWACERARMNATLRKRCIHETLIKQQMVYLSLLFSNHIISFKIRCVCIFIRTSEAHARTYSLSFLGLQQ